MLQSRPNVASELNTGLPVVVIGGGPAGLMAAEVIAQAGYSVHVYDAMPSMGRKFLLAGVGGMNITHAEPKADFITRYRERTTEVGAWLQDFDADALRGWIHELGVETFVGSSGRVFPREMKAAPLLRKWLQRLREQGVQLHVRHRWQGWRDNGVLRFGTPDGPQDIKAAATVLALGGASWARLGSDGRWVPWLRGQQVAVQPLMPANCGFTCVWTEIMQSQHAGAFVKSVGMRVVEHDGTPVTRIGEFIVTESGVEGSLIYAFSAPLREQIKHIGQARLELDLLPDRSVTQITQALRKPRGKQSMSNHLRRTLNLSGVKAALLRECAPQAFTDPDSLARAIKALPLTLTATRPIDEAISTAGGVDFSALNDKLMLQALPGVFCAGEMLDWEAPTGGYLLTACFASGRRAGQGVVDWLQSD
ncbi:TIGR03862 family flavoprotein [Salinispirillum sp. LH 10-3-1]|uniref:TIGR03862 family flavoprotein n=1 Tax=Salinispirillum sp. LH 10-3-1 TaxID=2952525 RepID=A0AB38YDI8_9GAMM